MQPNLKGEFMQEQTLNKVKILDLTWHIAGPFCTKLFADFGADVIKIERPVGGDPARRMGPFLDDDPHPEKSLLFSNLNLNKKSMALDLKTDSGKAVFKSLARDADILVESFSPGVMERLGFGYKTLKKLNPRLIMTSISNFGQTGPYRDFKASELVLNGLGADMRSSSPKTGGKLPSVPGGSYGGSRHPGSLLVSVKSSHRPAHRYIHAGSIGLRYQSQRNQFGFICIFWNGAYLHRSRQD